MQANDVAILLKWENDPANWEVSDTKAPFAKAEITNFVSQKQDIYLHQQLRLMVCLNNGEQAIGCVDLFEFDEYLKAVGVGILIATERGKGYGKEALNLLATYVKKELKLNQLFCNIDPINKISISLFESCGYSFTEKKVVFNKEVNHYQLVL